MMINYFVNKHIYSIDFINSHYISNIIILNIDTFNLKIKTNMITKSI